MIEPRMATMLGFLTTDAQVAPAILHRALAASTRDTNAIRESAMISAERRFWVFVVIVMCWLLAAFIVQSLDPPPSGTAPQNLSISGPQASAVCSTRSIARLRLRDA